MRPTVKKRTYHVRPRPFRLAGYLFWGLCMAAMYVMFRSFLLLFFTCFLVLIPLISMGYGWWLSHHISAGVSVPVSVSVLGEEICPTVSIRTTCFFGTLDSRVKLRIRNRLFDGAANDGEAYSELSVSLPVIGRIGRLFPGRRGASAEDGGNDEGEMRIPLTSTRIGGYRIRIEEVCVQDWFGLLRFSRTALPEDTSVSEFTVLPDPKGGRRPDPENLTTGMVEVEESVKRGNDFSEVTDIREYEPGDRIRDIHWKLSARQEEWMVKVRTQMAGMELNAAIVTDPEGDMTERIYRYAFRELCAWTQGETDIRLRVYRADIFGFDTYVLASAEDVKKAFESILTVYYKARIVGDGTPSAVMKMLSDLYPLQGGCILFGRTEEGEPGWMPCQGM